jgi:NAD-dependent dihydropyrimidine dehydrogenase PreA subunit
MKTFWSGIWFIFLNIFETLIRVLPYPCKTGLIKIGSPGKDSPVFVTCNYHLTVERVKRALKGRDAYLLVANSRGVNVWCGATGGHFTNHDIISVLKTSGIEDLVTHRYVILPQLAATGIESKAIQLKTGWRTVWGPVYAKNIPAFLDSRQGLPEPVLTSGNFFIPPFMRKGFDKTRNMRMVSFGPVQRIEMAVSWAFPFSLVASLIMFFVWRDWVVYTAALIWIVSFLIFLSFPLYAGWLGNKKQTAGFSKYTVLFDFGRTSLILWVLFMVLMAGYGLLTGNFSSGFMFRSGVLSFIIILVLNLDLKGSTPVYKSGLHEESLLKITIDENKCKGAAFCEDVCPKDCYDVDRRKHLASIPRSGDCVQCGACIVQCPFDALYFKSPEGEIVLPETIRRFKLNLLGKRLVSPVRKPA